MSEDKCVICLEKLTGDIRIIPCGHKFHTSCYGEWSNRTSGNITTCPCCRAENADPEYSTTRRRTRIRRPRHRIYIPPVDNSFTFLEQAFRNSHNGMTLDEVIRERMERNNLPVMNEMTTKEAIVSMILLFVILGIVYTFITVHRTCICNISWESGETTRTETYLFGSTTYNRPEICTYVC